MTGNISDFDRKIFSGVYKTILEDCRTPLATDLAAALSCPEEEVKESFRRLADEHYFLLQKYSGEVLMAFPFSAVSTPFTVEAGERSWYANCAWDSLGIISVLDEDARVKASCPCCGEAMTLRVENGSLVEGDGIVHFSVPARDWWKNVVYT